MKYVLKVLLMILLLDALLFGLALVYSTASSTSVVAITKKINYFTLTELFDFRIASRNQKANALIEKMQTITTSNTPVKNVTSNFLVIDTVVHLLDSSAFMYNPLMKEHTHGLDHFFNALFFVNDTSTLRIAHYGDSQLEGDRLTCYIRKEFQNKFGGYGIGYVPLTDITTHQQMLRSNSDNWERFNIFNNRYKNGQYSASGLLFKIIEEPDDAPITKATIAFDLYKTFLYNHISILYKSQEPYTIKTNNLRNGKFVSVDTLPAASDFTMHTLSIPQNFRPIQMEFNVSKSPELYGVLIDGTGGIQVDNYAIRGHSGERMSYADAGFIAKQLKQLKTKLLILQYGANVVPYFDNQKKCDYLEKVYYSLFMRYKTSLPDVSILVIGPGDMAHAKDGVYQSYENVSMVRDAQRRAALRAGCAFWDMYEAMGGQGSVLTWSSKGMAARDGHFYKGGQIIVAKQLFDALMVEYNNFLYRKTKNQIQ